MRKSVLSYKMPEISGPTYGTFAKIPHHEATHDKRYFETSYKDSYQKRFDELSFKPLDTKTLSGQLGAYAGYDTESKKVEKIRITTKLMSEKYNVEHEPKFNSIIQRTWNYHRDPAINSVETEGVDNRYKINLPPIDNELSLPLGNGSNFEKLRSRSQAGWKKTFSDVTNKTVKVSNLRKY